MIDILPPSPIASVPVTRHPLPHHWRGRPPDGTGVNTPLEIDDDLVVDWYAAGSIYIERFFFFNGGTKTKKAGCNNVATIAKFGSCDEPNQNQNQNVSSGSHPF